MCFLSECVCALHGGVGGIIPVGGRRCALQGSACMLCWLRLLESVLFYDFDLALFLRLCAEAGGTALKVTPPRSWPTLPGAFLSVGVCARGLMLNVRAPVRVCVCVCVCVYVCII